MAGHIGFCMRSDQSAVTLILAKLFREKMDHFAVRVDSFQSVDRDQRMNYFDEIEKNETRDSPVFGDTMLGNSSI